MRGAPPDFVPQILGCRFCAPDSGVQILPPQIVPPPDFAPPDSALQILAWGWGGGVWGAGTIGG